MPACTWQKTNFSALAAVSIPIQQPNILLTEKKIKRRRGHNQKFEVLTYQGWQEDCVVSPSNDGGMLLTLH
jgi:hypothetical protein